MINVKKSMTVVKKGLLVSFVIVEETNSVLNRLKKVDNTMESLVKFHTEIEVIVFVGVGVLSAVPLDVALYVSCGLFVFMLSRIFVTRSTVEFGNCVLSICKEVIASPNV